jgi:hypothetical protein
MPMANRTFLQMDQTTPEDQGLLWNLGECGQDTNLDCHLSICAGGNRQKGAEPGPESLHNFTDFERQSFRENAHITSTFKERLLVFKPCPKQSTEFIRLTLGH